MTADPDPTLVPVILCGGGGHRLWPLSTPARPKQFLRLTGPESLLQQTLARTARVAGGTPVLVSNAAYADLVQEHLSAITCRATVILETERRNTGPAVTLAALHLARTLARPGALMLVTPSDHAVGDGAAFTAAVSDAVSLAREGAVVALGVPPHHPTTAYGYMREGASLPLPGSTRKAADIDAFIEKPAPDVAIRLTHDSKHLWNSGILIVRADAWLTLIESHRPDVLECCELARRQGHTRGVMVYPDSASMRRCPGDFVAYTALEPGHAGTTVCATVRLEAGWSDLGTFGTLRSAMAHDPEGNTLAGNVSLKAVRDSMVIATHGAAAVEDLTGAVVVSTPHGLLVTTLDEGNEGAAWSSRRPHAGQVSVKGLTLSSGEVGSLAGPASCYLAQGHLGVSAGEHHQRLSAGASADFDTSEMIRLRAGSHARVLVIRRSPAA